MSTKATLCLKHVCYLGVPNDLCVPAFINAGESCGVNCFLVRDDVLGVNAMSAKDASAVRSELSAAALHRPQRFFGYEGWSHPKDERGRAFMRLHRGVEAAGSDGGGGGGYS